MNPNITLGEVKAHCIEMFERYKEECCEHCKFTSLGCCDAPESWKLDDHTPTNTEVMCDNGPMTVRKLIAYLELCSPDFPVYFEDCKIESVVERKDFVDPETSYVELG